VQIKNLAALTGDTCRIKIFVGKNQPKVPVELANAMQSFGPAAEYIQITGSGSNALDFHIAFYIGRLASEHPGATFVIISKDTGFDPLIKHLVELKIECKRLDGLPGAPETKKSMFKVPAAKTASPTVAKVKRAANVVVTFAPVLEKKSDPPKAPSTSARVAEVIKRLRGMKAAQPAKLATLQSSVKSWFKPPLDQKAIASIVQSLKDQKKISVSGTKVSYALG